MRGKYTASKNNGGAILLVRSSSWSQACWCVAHWSRNFDPPPAFRSPQVFIDDAHMPEPETWGAQPPIELLRQWLDYGGWYELKKDNVDFKEIKDLMLYCALPSPGGGRNALTPRFVRHFNVCVAGSVNSLGTQSTRQSAQRQGCIGRARGTVPDSLSRAPTSPVRGWWRAEVCPAEGGSSPEHLCMVRMCTVPWRMMPNLGDDALENNPPRCLRAGLLCAPPFIHLPAPDARRPAHPCAVTRC